MKKLICVWLVLALLMVASPVLASVITGALYHGEVRVTNSGNETASGVSVNFSLNSASLIDDGYANSTLTDLAIRLSGTDVAVMPGINGNPWITYVSQIGAGQNIDYDFYTGNVTGGEIRYFPSDDGMSANDSDTYEFGDNFTIAQKGWWNTTAIGATSANKSGVFRGHFISASGNITSRIISENSTITAVHNSDRQLYNGATTREGQRIDNFPFSTITRVDFYGRKILSPTGTIYCRIRSQSDDSVIGVLAEMDVSTLPGTNTWITFSGSVDVPTQQNIRVCVEYDGGDGSNFVVIRYNSSAVGGVGGNECNYNGSWNDNAGDLMFRLYFDNILEEVTATGISSGAFLMETTANVTHLKISKDGVEQDSTPLSANVTNNTANWTFCQNSVMPYMEYQTITINSTVSQNITWQYATTFTDLSGVGNDVSPTFRTTSSNTSVSADLISFDPVDEAEAATFTLGTVSDIISAAPSAMSQLFTEGDYSKVPGASAVNAMLDAGEIPRALWWYPFLFLGIGIVGLIIYSATHHPGGRGSIFAMCIVIEVLLALFGIMNPIVLWPALVFPIAAGAIIMSRKHLSWG